MKKLLSILAAVGLTATASTAVVACTTTVKASKGTWKNANELDYSDVKVNAIKELDGKTAKIAAGTSLGEYKLFDKDGNAVDATVTVKAHSDITKKIKKGKEVEADVTITFTAAQTDAKATTYYINDATITDKKKAKKGDATELKAPKYAKSSSDNGGGSQTGDKETITAATFEADKTTIDVTGTNFDKVKTQPGFTVKVSTKAGADVALAASDAITVTDGTSMKVKLGAAVDEVADATAAKDAYKITIVTTADTTGVSFSFDAPVKSNTGNKETITAATFEADKTTIDVTGTNFDKVKTQPGFAVKVSTKAGADVALAASDAITVTDGTSMKVKLGAAVDEVADATAAKDAYKITIVTTADTTGVSFSFDAPVKSKTVTKAALAQTGTYAAGATANDKATVTIEFAQGATAPESVDSTGMTIAADQKSGQFDAQPTDITKAEIKDGKLVLTLGAQTLTAGNYKLTVTADNTAISAGTVTFEAK